MSEPIRRQRSLTAELISGATDGALKKPAPNWSNRVCDVTDAARRYLSDGVNDFDWSPAPAPEASYVTGYVR